MNIPLNFEWIEAVMLAAVRMTTFLVIAPPFSHNAIPLRIKGMLGIDKGCNAAHLLRLCDDVLG